MATQLASPAKSLDLLRMTDGLIVHHTLCAAAKLGIADLLKDGARSTEQLAAELQVNEDALYRTLRFLAGQGVFHETAHREFANSELSEWLRSDVPGSVRSMLIYRGTPYFFSSLGNVLYSTCTMFLVLGVVATVSSASAEETPGIDGVWFTEVTPVDCQTGAVIPNVPSFRGLNMFGHDGSYTNDAAFLVPNPRRGAGLGTWRHTQAQTYTAAFRFFRYNADGSFMVMRKVTLTILLHGDQFTSFDRFQDFDANNNPLPTTGCNIETGIRVQ